MLLPVIILLLLGVAVGVYAGVCAGEDAYLIARNYDVSHLWQARQRGAALLGLALLAHVGSWSTAAPWWWYAGPLALAVAAVCLFGFLFDVWLNERRQLVWYYLGTDEHTAATDRKLNKLQVGGRAAAFTKLGGVVLGTGLYLLLWHL